VQWVKRTVLLSLFPSPELAQFFSTVIFNLLIDRAGHSLLFPQFAIRDFRYFNTSFRYRYSATFLKIAIRYTLFAIAIATFVS
jgi:hypothetical protein